MKQLAHFVFKQCIVTVFRLTGVFRLFRWLNRNRLIILTYHGVLPSGSDIEDYEARNVVDEEAFSWQMRYLAKHYRCVPLEEAVARLASGRPLPRYTVAVTFDDGFQNNLRYAFPILRWRGIPASIFLTTGHIGQGTKLLWTERVGRLLARAAVPQTVMLPGDPQPLTLSLRTAAEREHARRLALRWLKGMPSFRRDQAIQELDTRLRKVGPDDGEAAEPDSDRYAFLTWTEVRELAQRGVTVGSHTVDHPILTSLDHERRVDEVVQSKQEIERQLNAPCTLFSYPNGTVNDFDDHDKANLQRAGYVAAVAQIAGVNDEHTDRFALRRLNIGYGHTPQLFIAQVSGFWPWVGSIAARWSKVTAASGARSRQGIAGASLRPAEGSE